MFCIKPSKKYAVDEQVGSRRRRLAEAEEDKMIINDMKNSNEKHIGYTVSQPYNIKGKMRYYQVEALNWLISLHKLGISGILADEMGLGKTLEAISLLAYIKLLQAETNLRENQKMKHLIIIPKSTLSNWKLEFNTWCPTIRLLVL